MSVKSTKRHYSRGATRQTTALALRQLLAGLAILGLYVQLMAAGLCAAGSAAAADPAGFPICHTDVGGSDSAPSGNHPPASQHPCPFCAVHCHAAITAAFAVA